MIKVGTLLGGEINTTRHQMEEVFQFEKKLAEIYEPKERLRNMEEIYHKMTVAELQQLAPAVRGCLLNIIVPRSTRKLSMLFLHTLIYFSSLSQDDLKKQDFVRLRKEYEDKVDHHFPIPFHKISDYFVVLPFSFSSDSFQSMQKRRQHSIKKGLSEA